MKLPNPEHKVLKICLPFKELTKLFNFLRNVLGEALHCIVQISRRVNPCKK